MWVPFGMVLSLLSTLLGSRCEPGLRPRMLYMHVHAPSDVRLQPSSCPTPAGFQDPLRVAGQRDCAALLRRQEEGGGCAELVAQAGTASSSSRQQRRGPGGGKQQAEDD